MNLKFQAIKFEADEKLVKFVEKKAAKFDRFCGEDVVLDVTLKLLKPETALNKQADVQILANKKKYFASKTANTFEEALDLALEANEKQIKRDKEME